MTERTRSAVNRVTPQLLQRGQVFTWTRSVKERAFAEWGVTALVNFWPKTDSDLAELPLDWVWQISCPRSEMMLLPHIEAAARHVDSYLGHGEKRRVLVLCEAGKTRSVFFCIMVVRALRGCTYAQAEAEVGAAITTGYLKGFMRDRMREEDARA